MLGYYRLASFNTCIRFPASLCNDRSTMSECNDTTVIHHAAGCASALPSSLMATAMPQPPRGTPGYPRVPWGFSGDSPGVARGTPADPRGTPGDPLDSLEDPLGTPRLPWSTPGVPGPLGVPRVSPGDPWGVHWGFHLGYPRVVERLFIKDRFVRNDDNNHMFTGQLITNLAEKWSSWKIIVSPSGILLQTRRTSLHKISNVCLLFRCAS